MDHFTYKNDELYCENIPVSKITAEVGTPAYIYSAATFRRHVQNYREAFAEMNPLICYSVKGCSNINILKMVADLDTGFDVVSGGELFRVAKAGGDTTKVVYAGVGKTDKEINEAIDANIAYFNVESEAELANLTKIANERKTIVKGALRVNPDVDPKTHRYTTTGKKESKFGVDIERAVAAFQEFGKDEYFKLCAIHLHLGSPINTTDPYVLAIDKALVMIEELRAQGFEIEAIDIGGGFGADYTTGQAPLTADYADVIIPMLRDKGLKLILEPGRSISGNAGIMVGQVVYVKKGGDKNFAILDAGMNDLIRPSLYEAFHFAWPVKVKPQHSLDKRMDPMNLSDLVKTDIVGPICETGDYLALDRNLPAIARGDQLAIFTAGAYGFAMSSQYNSHPRAAEVLVDGDSFKVIRQRESYDDLIAAEMS
ncbi:MAG: diaminopimelate decarboxylase [Phycisphaerae bacterium]|nr:diaminopimelate decarboxylase [Phycisphaerae bacterium]